MTSITYIGHATTLIEIGQIRLLTDPILRNRVWHLRRRNTSIQDKWYQSVDAVLISHIHWDHLHLPSLRLLDRDTCLIVPIGCGSMFARKGFRHIEELTVGDSLKLGSTTITATRAQHDGGRFLSRKPADTLGYVIDNEVTVYFAGDTDLFPEMADLADALDIALLPVWGWGPSIGEGHLNPYRAALALQMLMPKMAIPIHWGTLHPMGLNLFNPDFLTDPPHAFARFAAQLAPEVTTEVLSPGQNTIYEANKGTLSA